MRTHRNPRLPIGPGLIGLFAVLAFGLLVVRLLQPGEQIDGVATESVTELPKGDDYAATIESGFLQTQQAALTSIPSPAPGTEVIVPTVKPQATAFLPLPESTPLGSGALFFGAVAPYSRGAPIYHITSQWYQDFENGRRRVYVGVGSLAGEGGRSQATDKGVVVVNVVEWVTQLGLTYPETVPGGGEYRTPVDTGTLTINGAQDARLILLSTNGTTFYFDVPARRFVSSLTEVVPTITPWPTYTSMPSPTSRIGTPYPGPVQSPYPAPIQTVIAP
jgi:hypothetical protein